MRTFTRVGLMEANRGSGKPLGPKFCPEFVLSVCACRKLGKPSTKTPAVEIYDVSTKNRNQ